MNKFNFFQKFAASIARIRLYPHFMLRGAGSAIGYLMLLTLTLGTISLIRPSVECFQAIDLLSANFENFRDFTFSNGELSMSGDMPYITGTSTEAIIVDTTGNTGKEILEKYESGILITNNKMFQKQNTTQITETDFSVITGFTVTKATVAKYIPLLKGVVFFVILFGWIGFFISKLWSALLVGLIGLIIASVQKAKLSFSVIYAGALYSLTLPIVVKVALGAASIKMPGFFMLYYAGAAIYLAFAIKATKTYQEEAAIPPSTTIPPEPPTSFSPQV